MKKIICLFLSALFLFFFVCIACAAETKASDETTEYFEDGTYIVINITETVTEEEENIFARLLTFLRKIISLFTNNKTVSKTKYTSYYDSKGTLLWTVYLNAEFTYNGKTSYCKNASVNAEIFDGDWELINSEASTENNTAEADFTVQQYKIGVKLKTVQKHISLSCDKNGNIS